MFAFKNGLRSFVSPVTAIAPSVLDEDNAPAEIDLLGFNSATILLYVGAGGITFSGSNKIEFKLTHGSESGSLSAVAARDVPGIAASDLTNGEISDGIIKTLNAEHASASYYVFDYVGKERYIELLADFSGTHGTGTMLAATILKGGPRASSVVPESEISTGYAA